MNRPRKLNSNLCLTKGNTLLLGECYDTETYTQPYIGVRSDMGRYASDRICRDGKSIRNDFDKNEKRGA